MMLEFKTEKVSKRITRIYAFSTELMYLVEGTDQAVLIDTGSGFGSLKTCVEQLTHKPLAVLMTHGHVDHAMGAGEFEHIYMNSLDEEVYRVHASEAFRLAGLKGLCQDDCVEPADMVPAAEFERFQELMDGAVFDLGSVHIEIYGLCGHTAGSVVMLIPEERTLILGDACNPFLFLFDEFSTGLTTYEANLRKLRERITGKYDTVLLSHGSGVGAVTTIEDVLQVCADIKTGNTTEGTFPFMEEEHYFADNGTNTKICYNRDRIWE